MVIFGKIQRDSARMWQDVTRFGKNLIWQIWRNRWQKVMTGTAGVVEGTLRLDRSLTGIAVPVPSIFFAKKTCEYISVERN